LYCYGYFNNIELELTRVEKNTFCKSLIKKLSSVDLVLSLLFSNKTVNMVNQLFKMNNHKIFDKTSFFDLSYTERTKIMFNQRFINSLNENSESLQKNQDINNNKARFYSFIKYFGYLWSNHNNHFILLNNSISNSPIGNDSLYNYKTYDYIKKHTVQKLRDYRHKIFFISLVGSLNLEINRSLQIMVEFSLKCANKLKLDKSICLKSFNNGIWKELIWSKFKRNNFAEITNTKKSYSHNRMQIPYVKLNTFFMREPYSIYKELSDEESILEESEHDYSEVDKISISCDSEDENNNDQEINDESINDGFLVNDGYLSADEKVTYHEIDEDHTLLKKKKDHDLDIDMEIMPFYNHKFSLKKQRLLFQEKINKCKNENLVMIISKFKTITKFQINIDYLYQFHFEVETNKNLLLPSPVYLKESIVSITYGYINDYHCTNIQKKYRKIINIDFINKCVSFPKAQKNNLNGNTFKLTEKNTYKTRLEKYNSTGKKKGSFICDSITTKLSQKLEKINPQKHLVYSSLRESVSSKIFIIKSLNKDLNNSEFNISSRLIEFIIEKKKERKKEFIRYQILKQLKSKERLCFSSKISHIFSMGDYRLYLLGGLQCLVDVMTEVPLPQKNIYHCFYSLINEVSRAKMKQNILT
jgi:hypothetical protein